MAKDRHARRRERYTGQSYHHALESIRRDGPEHGAIPAAMPTLANLEAISLERIGRWDPAIWTPDTLGFGISWVDPSPTSIALGIPTRYLPDIVQQLMPTALREDLEHSCGHEYVEVWGVPGLRHRIDGTTVTLFRPGLPGSMTIPLASADLWDKAIQIAKHGWDDGVGYLWDDNPNDWHPAERTFIKSWPAAYETGNSFYRHSRLASDVLRRLPAICAPFSAHDMWFNGRGLDSGYAIQFEWQNGRPPHAVLDLLLDSKDGLGVRIDTHNGAKPLDHAYADDSTRVRLISDSGSRLDLRHSRFETSPDDRRPTLDALAKRRLQLEEDLGYPSSAKYIDNEGCST